MKTIFRTVLLLCLTTFTINAEPLINLDKVLDIFTATAKAMPAAESKEAAKRDARIQTFVTQYTKSLNETKISNLPLAAEYQTDGSETASYDHSHHHTPKSERKKHTNAR